MDEFLSIADDGDDEITGARSMAPAQGDMLVLVYQFRPTFLHRLMCPHKPTHVDKLTCHLKLLHMVEKMHLSKGIMKSWPRALNL